MSDYNGNDSFDQQRHNDSVAFDKTPLLAPGQSLLSFPQTTTVVTTNDEDDDEHNQIDANDGSGPTRSSNKKISNSKLGMIVGAFIVMSIVSTVGRKLVLDAFGQHLAFFRQILGVFMYDVWCSIFVVYKLVRTNDIPLEVRQANPLYIFAAIGFLDGLGDFLSSVGGVHSPGAIQTLLGQLVIPLTLVIAFFLTKSKFSWVQIFGAVVIIGGVCVATIPDLDKTRNTNPTHDKTKEKQTGSAEGEKTYWYSIAVFAASQIPQAASIVSKDFLFKRSRGKLDVFYLSCLVSWTQLFLIWSFVPLQSFPALGGVPLDQIGEVMEDGARCFLGQDVPKDRSSINWTAIDLGLANASSIERCRGDAYLPIMTFAYSLCGFFQGILSLMIVKYHSASLAILCNAITLPLSNLAYSIPAFVGGSQNAEPFSAFDLGGLVITVFGLLVYQSRALRKQFCQSCWPVREPNEAVLISGASRGSGGEVGSPNAHHHHHHRNSLLYGQNISSSTKNTNNSPNASHDDIIVGSRIAAAAATAASPLQQNNKKNDSKKTRTTDVYSEALLDNNRGGDADSVSSLQQE